MPKKQQKTTKTPKEFGNGSLWKKAEPPLLHYCSPAGLISEERKQGPVPGWTLPIVEAAEFGTPNPTISLPRLSAEIHPPHPPACVLGFIRRQLCFGALLRREGTATSTGRRGAWGRKETLLKHEAGRRESLEVSYEKWHR